jgi:thiol-disulfide isomerase/thioredoxin
MRVTNYVVALILAYISLSESDAAAIVEPSDSKVKSVEFVNFQSFISSQPLVLMQFYTEWNGFSRDLAPKFREAAAQLAAANLQRPVILAKYDDSTEEQRKLRAGAADVYNFHSYPALVVFDQGKPQRYSGGLEVADIVSYMTAVSKGQIMSTEHKPGTGLFESMPSYDEDVLTELSPEQFESIVLGEKHVCRLFDMILRLPVLQHTVTAMHEIAMSRHSKFDVAHQNFCMNTLCIYCSATGALDCVRLQRVRSKSCFYNDVARRSQRRPGKLPWSGPLRRHQRESNRPRQCARRAPWCRGHLSDAPGDQPASGRAHWRGRAGRAVRGRRPRAVAGGAHLAVRLRR